MSEQDLLNISAESVRVLGVLLEKEKTTPDNYPLTLNSLVLGCNQSTNRSPVVEYSELEVERALGELRDIGLSLRGVYAGSRVPKHRHSLENVLELSPGAQAILTVLLLRGSQTLGELKQRTERLYNFENLDECDKAIDELCNYNPELAVRLSKQPGQKEGRINHRFTFSSASGVRGEDNSRPAFQLIEGEKQEYDFDNDLLEEDELMSRVDRLEKEVTVLTHEIMSLRAQIDDLRDPSA